MKWLDKLKDYAPDIAAAVLSGGATLPQLALKAVGEAIGKPIATVEQLGAAVESASPEEMLKVQQSNNAFKIRMAELGNELTATELGDIQNAREQHKHSRMPATICIALTSMVAGVLIALFKFKIPESNGSIIYMVIGQIITLWGGSVVFFIGTTRSSAVKTAAMLKGK